MNESVSWMVAITLGLTSSGLLISRNWRISLGLFVMQYFAGFLFLLDHWLLSMSATLLVAGWMSAAALGMTLLNVRSVTEEENSWPQGSLFRIFAAGLALLAVTAAASNTSTLTWLPKASQTDVWGALVLIGLGFLHLGMTLHPLRVTLGLLTTLLGFEIFYSTVENSLLVTGLLVIVTLGLALTGCYLLVLGEIQT